MTSLLLVIIAGIAWAGNITLHLSATVARIGDTVTATGIADSNTFVSIKVLDSSRNIVAFDAVKSNQTGNYTCTFTVPTGSDGNLNVIVGHGNIVASKNLIIGNELVLANDI